MPIPIGKFISSNVYDNKLKSQHDLTDWKVCRFVNVKGSNEKRKGTSWVNELEIETAVAIAGTLHSRGLSFRIITPYDPQKCLLETALKSKKLPSEDKCFNVDSFQGNEADYIIISLVRTAKLGFLREDRRANVMLTRCKKGMVICTNRAFIAGVAKKSLVGKLAKHVGEKAWIDSQQVRFANVNPFS
ncbi:hypothetical protein FA15DRAFT_94068 [Coprinopsis marcescibilis]|uniref:DNA2/NAM7 helicase-like C-terminal domain-containing protein n=1 Tax=Coprinopsis marcescibilis TaxID=230819 RepID=A0A5C3KLP6_COPMA|nr:hypothetical protein FA15DRAFT_94068 [Coprinopsis marcescibilis]